jgi:NAD(P)H-nitrite reductase large subunit
MKKKYVIIGASAAGISAAKEIRAIDESGSITVVSDDSREPYFRPLLSELIADPEIEKKNGFNINRPEWYKDNSVTLLLNEKAAGIDSLTKTIRLASGGDIQYDRLIIAAGSSPFVPPVLQNSDGAVYTLRSYADALNIREKASGSSAAVVVGGGLLGLETAYSLKKMGLSVAIVELAERIMPLQLDEGGSAFLAKLISSRGIDLRLCDSIESVSSSGTGFTVRLSSGSAVPADMIVVSAGVRPNLELPANCGLSMNRGLVVDRFMRTSNSDIYACGDLTEFNGKLMPLWMPAMKKGKVAGSNAAGRELEFADEDFPVAINTFETKIFSAGETSLHDGDQVHSVKVENESGYKRLIFRDNILRGFILIGDTSASQKYLSFLKKGSLKDEIESAGLLP